MSKTIRMANAISSCGLELSTKNVMPMIPKIQKLVESYQEIVA